MIRVLVVEDEPVAADAHRVYVDRTAGFTTVAVAGSGAVALETLARVPVQLVLLDMNLPVMDGWTAARTLRADPETARVPIIALTAHAMAGDKAKALEAGCDDYHPKPVDFSRLLSQIDAVLLARGETA